MTEENTEGRVIAADHINIRDHIADRTADLLREATSFTEQYQKPGVMMVQDPISMISVPAVLSSDSVKPFPKDVFDPYRQTPERRTGVATMTRLDSFIGHANRFKTDNSAIFANDSRTSPSLTAVLDYHDPVNVEDGDDTPFTVAASPRFCQHRTSFHFPLSDEWKAWNAANSSPMSMKEFAEFLEDRIVDVEAVDDPSTLNEDMRRFIGNVRSNKIAGPSKLMELATSLHVNENSVVKQAVNLASGEGQIRFESQNTDENGAPVDVPGLFVICIPVFAHDGYYRMIARLRYRAAGGIKFWFDLWRPDLVFDDAFDAACRLAADKTNLPLFIGAPEI